ncbi:MAG TPA: stage III sporulation protein AE [Candidatus Choladousia intestinipullorum]|nr:stage III sporulation protein AE [Candidatus Choladousia intestinipullorum]
MKGIIAALLVSLLFPFFPAQAEEETEADIPEMMEEYLEIEAIQDELFRSTDSDEFSFSDAVKKMLTGQMPLDLSKLPAYLSDVLFGELKQQKKLAVQILIIVLASAVFTNFIKVFDNSQIAEISFYVMYLLISALLLKSFMDMNQIAADTCNAMNRFMKVLLPSYLATVVLCAGSVSAIGFYQITVLGMNLLQVVILRFVFPLIHFYLILLLLNQMGKEDYFSQLAGLIETGINWIIKTMMGVVIGLQAVQCLIAPAVDSMKNSALHRLAKTIPGVGSLLDTAVETVAGSAVIIKNAVGVAGILALAFICLVPLVKLAGCIFMFKLLCSLIQPVSEKRMVEGIESISRSTGMLLRLLVAALSIFIVSLAMITASVKGG